MPKNKLSVLLIEDDPVDQILVRRVLAQSEGVEVDFYCAGGLRDGLAALEAPPSKDIILLDLNLPDSQGLDTVRAVRGSAPYVPVVVLTGQTDEAQAMEAMEYGVQDYISKSLISNRMLLRIIRYAIERARNQKELQDAYDRLEKTTRMMIRSEKMSAIGLLAAGIAHELNNPMMGILNFIEYCLNRTNENDRCYEILRDAKQETKRCIEIIKSLLTFSYTGEDEAIAYESGNCVDIMERVLRLLGHRISHEGVKVVTHYQEKIPPVWVNPGGMQQVFLNLLVNALDALEGVEKKEVSVDIQAQEGEVRISVSDSGCGIPGQIEHQIFNPFFTTKPTGKGTGLGLSVSEGIVRRHQGRLSLRNRPGPGTTFVVSLPIGQAEKGEYDDAQDFSDR